MKDFGLQTSEVIVNIDQLCLDMDAVDSQVFYLPSQLQQAKKKSTSSPLAGTAQMLPTTSCSVNQQENAELPLEEEEEPSTSSPQAGTAQMLPTTSCSVNQQENAELPLEEEEEPSTSSPQAGTAQMLPTTSCSVNQENAELPLEEEEEHSTSSTKSPGTAQEKLPLEEEELFETAEVDSEVGDDFKFNFNLLDTEEQQSSTANKVTLLIINLEKIHKFFRDFENDKKIVGL